MATLASSPIFAKAAGLSYANPDEPGIARVSSPRGMLYRRPDGATVKDAATLERIGRLAIPPAWRDVWISLDPAAHIQAVGRDLRGRKQYRYHDDWRQVRDAAKFDRVSAFGRALPKLRRRIEQDLRRQGLPREKVLAAAVRLLEITLIRVGNPEYARDNKSFGLTTFRDRHVKVRGAEAVFEFRGKSGKLHRTGFRNRRLARVVAACQDLPGQRLFQYLDAESGERRAIGSADVNAYLREALGEDFSAKDFRTWAGTLAAARALLLTEPAESDAEAKARVATCVKAVAGLLGNTPAVCRACYIHPEVIDAYGQGRLALKAGEGRPFELAVLRFLDRARSTALRPRRPRAPAGASHPAPAPG